MLGTVPFEPDLYPLFIAVGSAGGVFVAISSARESGYGMKSFLLQYACLCLGAFAGAKIASIGERGWAVQPLSWELMQAYRYPGGIVGLAVVLFAIAARPRVLQGRSTSATRRGWRDGIIAAGRLADVLAPATGVAMAFVRLGCFLAGCCAGQLSRSPWSVRFAPGSEAFQQQVARGLIAANADSSLAVLPLQLYFALLSLGAAFVVLRRRQAKSFEGELFLLYIAIHEAGKGGLEYLRFEPAPIIQLASLAFASLAAATLAFMRRYSRRISTGVAAATASPAPGWELPSSVSSRDTVAGDRR